MSSFVFYPHGQLGAARTADIFFSAKHLTIASMYARQCGPLHLRSAPLNYVRGELRDFIKENYGFLVPHLPLRVLTGSFADHIPQATRSKLADMLASSRIFQPVDELTLFPLVTIRVQEDFVSDRFFLVEPQRLRDLVPPKHFPNDFLVDQFPPVPGWEGKRETVSAWLGVNAPSLLSAQKAANAILGGIALTSLPQYRYRFSGRKIFGGRCSLNSGYTISWGPALTPPLYDDIVISATDREWLRQLSELIDDATRRSQLKLRALEYFYRAWPLTESERFPILCMCLDGLYGDQSQATQAVIRGIRTSLGIEIPYERLNLLMKLRASVIHGGAPDVYDSSKYARYYRLYDDDPIFDLEVLVATCLRSTAFDGKLIEHPDPNEAVIADLRKKGRLPTSLRRKHILAP